MTKSAQTTHAVHTFYKDLAFNYYGDTKAAVQSVQRNPVAVYTDLVTVLEQDSTTSILEIGCGAGWAANSIAYHYGKTVKAVDMTSSAVVRANDVATALGQSKQVCIKEMDLFDLKSGPVFDLVYSIGVLHHTYDCREAFAHIANMVRPGGHLYVGLYHSYGRTVFLEMFARIIANEGEDAAFAKYRKLNPHLTDETHVWSWFRDQVLHPHETQHSLEEVWGWLDTLGFTLSSTSINAFVPTSDRDGLIAQEKTMAELSRRRNLIEGTYFPGFFTVMAKRTK